MVQSNGTSINEFSEHERQTLIDAGKHAARALWEGGTQHKLPPDPRHPVFANAALEEIERAQDETAEVVIESLEGAERSATQLNISDFYGLVEIVQNADDVGASKVTMTTRGTGNRRQLLIAHNGRPVELPHVVAMALAFLSTKRDDPSAKGRFGIGLKTLSRIAQSIEVHCYPYHFRIYRNKVSPIRPIRKIAGLVPGDDSHTLIVLNLARGVDPQGLVRWFMDWKPSNMLGLDSVRTLALLSGPSMRARKVHQLTEEETAFEFIWNRESSKIPVRSTKFRDPKSGDIWTKYVAVVNPPDRLSRAFKATGSDTKLAIILPHNPGTYPIFSGLPTQVNSEFPLIIDAQFDPDTSRTRIQNNDWNDWLFARLGDLLTQVGVHLMATNPRLSWTAVPVLSEVHAPDDWIADRLRRLVKRVHTGVNYRARLEVDGDLRRLHQVSYETMELEGLLEESDYRWLTRGRPGIPQSSRDQSRWRIVVEELDTLVRIEFIDALQLFAKPSKTRSPQWYVSLVAIAIETGVEAYLTNLPCLLGSNLETVKLPQEGEGSILVHHDSPSSLAHRMKLVKSLHQLYFDDSLPSAVRVRAWLEDNEWLVDKIGDQETLAVLAGRQNDEPLELADSELLELRDVIDRTIDVVSEDILTNLGRTVLVDAYYWEDGHQRRQKVVVANCYLPNSIDREPQSWAKTADRTPGLFWVSPRYAAILNPGERRSGKSGARRFLTFLGGHTSPRLIESTDTYLRGVGIPALQLESFKELSRPPQELIDDYTSPDLEAVVKNICDTTGKRQRRERGIALFGILARTWRNYQGRADCVAGYSHYGWKTLGRVPATWIARLAEEPWLMTESGIPTPPRLLGMKTSLASALFGRASSYFASGIEDNASTRNLANALGMQSAPGASGIVDELVRLRGENATPENEHINQLYSYLARLCPQGDFELESLVDDLTVRQLRGYFGTNPRFPGLIYANGDWRVPSGIRLGPPIFGEWGTFKPSRGHSEQLWKVLGMRSPDIEDCIDVLEAIADKSTGPEEQSVLADTYRYMNGILGAASKRVDKRLQQIPLWCQDGWTSHRPVYVVDDEKARTALSGQIPIWRPPCSLVGLEVLTESVGIAKMGSADCVPLGIGPSAFVGGEQLRVQFGIAVASLQNYLGEHHPGIFHELRIGWNDLAAAGLMLVEDLTVESQLPDGSTIVFPTNAHMDINSTVIYVRGGNALWDPKTGGRLIAEFFSTEMAREIVPLVWAHPSLTNRGTSVAPISLAKEPSNAEEDPLDQIIAGARSKLGRTSDYQRRDNTHSSQGSESTTKYVVPRYLKTFESITLEAVTKVGVDSSPGKRITPKLNNKLNDDLNNASLVEANRPNAGVAPRGYTESEKEQLALKYLMHAIQTGSESKLRDFTKRKLIGADAIDDLKRFFEVKAYYGEMPDTVRIEFSETKRAQEAGKDFYLAIVVGLEVGYDTIVRLFPEPLKTLDWRQGSVILLSGIRTKRGAVDFHFS